MVRLDARLLVVLLAAVLLVVLLLLLVAVVAARLRLAAIEFTSQCLFVTNIAVCDVYVMFCAILYLNVSFFCYLLQLQHI